MKRLLLIIISVTLPLTFLVGCWDQRELDKLAVVVGLSIDKAGDDYLLGSQIVNTSEVSTQANPSGAAAVTIRSETAPTLYEASRKTSMVTPKRIYVSHLRVLVISEEVAKEGITDVLDLFSRDSDFRSDFIVIIAKDMQAIDTLKTLTSLEKIPANQLYESLKMSQEVWAESININFRELMKVASIKGNSIVLSGIEVKGDKEIGSTIENTTESDSPAKLAYTGIAIFEKEKLIGWLDAEESKGYSYITNKINNTVEHINCSDNNKMSIEVTKSKAKIKVNFASDDTPEVTVSVNIIGNIGETYCKMDLIDPKSITKIEKLVQEEITKIINKSVSKAQTEYTADIFGFGQHIKATNPQQWRKLEKNWPEHFTELKIDLKVNAKIDKLGTIVNSVKDEIEE